MTCFISIADDYLIKCISIFSRIIDGAVVDTKPTMAPSRCEHQDCDWSHDDTDIKVFIEMLKFHCDARHPKNVAVDKTKPEKASDKTEAALKDEELTQQLKQIAVKKRNLLVNRFKVFKLKQVSQ